MYIEIPLHENYKRYLDVILSNDEKDVSSILSEMMKYHKKTAHIESFTKNEILSHRMARIPNRNYYSYTVSIFIWALY